MQGDEKWHEVIINLKDITEGGGPIPDGDAEAVLRVKPYKSGEVILEEETYIDVEYIACFKTEEEAAAFKYNGEKPVDTLDDSIEYFYEEATDEIISKYMDEMDARIAEILNTPTTVEVTGTKYYVSSSTGNDDNDGLTPETAWKTAEKASTFYGFKDGDGVFFKRGDEWRITDSFGAHSGVTYSAYGSGAKPKLICSVDASYTAMWLPTEYENIYECTVKFNGENNDVGTIVFDGGRAWGIHVQPRTNGKRVDNGTVFNGLETYTIPAGDFRGYQDLKGNLEFHLDWDTETLYLYCEGGNPAEVFSSIEIADKPHGIKLLSSGEGRLRENIVIDNIEVVGTGSHGISSGSVKNVIVQNCVFRWIGGSIQSPANDNRDYAIRLGNAVESFGASDNFIIRNNYATQVYDCCWTVQTTGAEEMNNVQIYDNVSEYCNTALEVWQNTRGGSITNMKLHDNYTRFNGYGFSHQRPTKDANVYYGTSANSSYENNDVYNNVSLFTSKYIHKCAATGTEQYNFHDNVYIMEEGKYIGNIPTNPGMGRGGLTDTPFNEDKVAYAMKTGFEKGTKFYYTKPEPYENMYAACLPTENGVNAFDDIADDFWGRKAIDATVLQGLFKGVSATEFAPNSTMTRAMLVTVLSRLANGAGSGKTTYTDVNNNAWYISAVSWAEENGIVDAGGAFRPDANVTREEMADMLYRLADVLYKKIDLGSAKAFTDSASVDAKYADGIKFCTINGIIGGYEDGTIKPKNSATRAEVATMITRFKNYLGSAENDPEKILAHAERVTLTGETLKSALDNTQVRAEVKEDSSIKFTTFTESGMPWINILDSITDAVNIADYGYAVIECEADISSENKMLTALGYVKPGAGRGYNLTDIRVYKPNDETKILLDYSTYSYALDPSQENDNLAIVILPWGYYNQPLNSADSFILKSVTFFKDKTAAQAYMG